jgi:hypothetical protein
MLRAATVSLLACLLSVPVALAAEPPGTVSLRDPRLTESSGLVDLGSRWVTMNDSGDSARLFTLDPVTGRTIGISHFHSNVVDLEALAPSGRSVVWVGDIGDNGNERASISVFRVLVGPGRIDVQPRRYRLVYPRGNPDAESLFADRQGRLHVITKSFGGGVVYRAPARLSSQRPNRLVAVGAVQEYATDAALTRDRNHVLVRGPALAGVYTVPGFQRVTSFALPRQPQGEGISVGPTGLVRVSSEGAHTAVRQVSLPAAVATRIGAPVTPTPSPTPSPSASPSPSATSTPSPTADGSPGASPSPVSGDSSQDGVGALDSPWLMWSIPAVIAVGALGIGLGLRRRTD